MKIVSIQDLVVGDVFAKEIKLKGRQAFEVVEKPKHKEFLIAIPRGSKDTTRIGFKAYPKVYFLRSTK